ncbi:PIR Superfamily Protein [Plasmodium ovale curtisi]|uniref:PIR Superfamily Protein n=1 Tax=Plasmodium ovale curtisi TaxID=864141 RepID=A0A1A8X9I3_PLAOA|nr:PIR Superfamily Protein [Plasmodium ovale curtisi]
MNSHDEDKYVSYNTLSEYISHKVVLDYYANDSHTYYKEDCEKIIETYLNGDSAYIKPCIALLKYSYNSKQDSSLSFFPIPCESISMWLKEQTKDILNNAYTISQFYKILQSHDRSKSLVDGVCNDKINDIETVLFDKLQILYNLYVNLSNYRNIWFDSDINNCKYANICADSYEEHIPSCNSTNPNPFCKALFIFGEQYNYEMQTEYGCKDIKKKILTYPGQENTEIQQERRDTANPLQTTPAQMGEGPREVGSSEHDSLHYSNIIPVSIILLFTSLRSILRHWIGEKKKKWCNNYEHDDQLPYNSENEETDLKNMRYNIQYHTA